MSDKSTKPTIRLNFKDSGASSGPAPQAPQASAKAGSRPQPAGKPRTHPPLLGIEPLVVKCGHTIAFELYTKNAFRDQRRAKATQRDCPPCRQARVANDAKGGEGTPREEEGDNKLLHKLDDVYRATKVAAPPSPPEPASAPAP